MKNWQLPLHLALNMSVLSFHHLIFLPLSLCRASMILVLWRILERFDCFGLLHFVGSEYKFTCFLPLTVTLVVFLQELDSFGMECKDLSLQSLDACPHYIKVPIFLAQA